MTTRTVTGTVLNADGTADASSVVTFDLLTPLTGITSK